MQHQRPVVVVTSNQQGTIGCCKLSRFKWNDIFYCVGQVPAITNIQLYYQEANDRVVGMTQLQEKFFLVNMCKGDCEKFLHVDVSLPNLSQGGIQSNQFNLINTLTLVLAVGDHS